jgi:hypothetical protein
VPTYVDDTAGPTQSPAPRSTAGRGRHDPTLGRMGSSAFPSEPPTPTGRWSAADTSRGVSPPAGAGELVAGTAARNPSRWEQERTDCPNGSVATRALLASGRLVASLKNALSACRLPLERGSRLPGSRRHVARNRREYRPASGLSRRGNRTAGRRWGGNVFTIWVDPHKARIPPRVLHGSDSVIDELRVADRHQRDRLLSFATRYDPRTWRSKAPAGAAHCWPNNSSLPASPSSRDPRAAAGAAGCPLGVISLRRRVPGLGQVAQ